jgi:hypothetical protein
MVVGTSGATLPAVFAAAAVCPHPPLLVPALAKGAGGEIEPVRAAARESLRRVLAADPDLMVCVGDAPAARTWGSGAAGSLAPYGVDVCVGGPDPMESEALPLALTVGAWLLDESGYVGERRYVGVPDSFDPARCADLGASLAARADRVGFLVMGDGSARRDERAPGAVDPRAPGWDARVVASLGSGDLDGLRGLQPDLARELLAAGRAAWQVLAGAADSVVGRRLEASVLADEAPYGVGYFVASWRLDGLG